MNVLPEEIAVVDQNLHPVRRLTRMKGSGDFSEADFDRLIVEHVESIAGALRSAGLIDEGCTLRVLAQTNQVANIDVLLAEVDGEELRRLVLVETKLFRNPEAKREVLAQILDYAKKLQFDVGVEEIVAKVDEPTRTWLNRHPERLQALKARGDFLLLICGDRIQPDLVEIAKPMLDHRNHVVSRVELALVSLALYEGDGSIVLVPNLVGAVVCAERDLCIEVTVRSHTGELPTVKAQVLEQAFAEARTAGPRRVRRSWTREAFLEQAAQGSAEAGEDENYEPALRDLLAFADETEGLSISFGTGRTNATFVISVDDPVSPMSLGAVWSDARIYLYRNVFGGVLGEARSISRVAELLERLGLAEVVDANKKEIWLTGSGPLFDLRKPAELKKFKDWLVEMRDEIRAVGKTG
jgi:hypothetical protein